MKFIMNALTYLWDNWPNSFYSIVIPAFVAILTFAAAIGGYKNINYQNQIRATFRAQEIYNNKTQQIDLLVAKIQNGDRLGACRTL